MTAVLAGWACIGALVASPAAQARAKADYLTMSSNSDFAGTILAQFTPTAVKMRLDKLGVAIVTKAPAWNAVMYNESSKKCLEMSYKEWKQKLNMGRLGGMRTKAAQDVTTTSTGNKQDILGMKAEELKVSKSNGPRRPATEFSVWVTRQVTPPVQFMELLHNFASIPIDKGLPLRVVTKKGKGDVNVFETYKVDRKPIPPSAFDVPKGMKKAQDEMELMVDENDLDFMNSSAPSTTKPSGDAGKKPPGK